MDLSNVETDSDATTQAAYDLIIHRGKCAIQKTVGQFDVVDHSDQTGHANQCVDLLSLKSPGNLDLEIVVDVSGCVL